MEGPRLGNGDTHPYPYLLRALSLSRTAILSLRLHLHLLSTAKDRQQFPSRGEVTEREGEKGQTLHPAVGEATFSTDDDDS